MIKALNEGFDKLLNETSCEESDTRRFDRRGELGDDVAEYQRWVDYDMKRFGRISKRTMDTVRKAGLNVVKDQYGDYEVIAKAPIEEAKSYNSRVFTYKVGDKTYRFYCHTEDTKYGFRHLCDVFYNGQPVAYATSKYYNRTWETFDYQSVMKKASDLISNATEDEKKDLIDQIEDGEGIREGCEENKCAEGKCNENEDDFDISDDEYFAELEAHIKRIPSYKDTELKAEYKEFKDSTHEDDKRVEDALFAEMIKRGFVEKK
ncbi:MAG: hypothetical protein J6S67_19895 [Methanobrevibacter sp.]|nr:hypothetical protein [Methanobrevibacter sp.]